MTSPQVPRSRSTNFAWCGLVFSIVMTTSPTFASDVKCANPVSLTPELKALCQQLSALPGIRTFLLPVTPISPIYRAARQRVSSGDASLKPRVQRYEQRWLDTERIRRSVNRDISREVDSLSNRGLSISPENYVDQLSAALQSKVVQYRRMVSQLEEVWKPQPPDSLLPSDKASLKWIENAPGDDTPKMADLDAAVRLLDELEQRNRERAQLADMRAEMANVDRQRLNGNGSYGDPTRVAGSNPGYTNTNQPCVASPCPPGQTGGLALPGAWPDPANPDGTNASGNSATAPPPTPPGDTGSPQVPASPPVKCSIPDLTGIEQLIRSPDNTAALQAVRHKVCSYYNEYKAKCPAEYQQLDNQISKAWTGSKVPYPGLKQLACGDLLSGGPDTSGFSNPAEVEMLAEACNGGGYECREEQAQPVSVCVTIPSGATIVDEKLMKKFLDESRYEAIAMNQDGAWCKFITRNVKADDGGQQVCYGFINWSHNKKRQVRVSVTWK